MFNKALAFLTYLILIILLINGGNTLFAAEVYKIDPAHSSIEFTVTHLMVSEVKGGFGDYAGTITYDKTDPKTFATEATIKTASIDTHQSKRDEHLKSADFFDAENFPTITFKSKQLTDSTLTGDLTIRGVTKQISMPVKINGPVNSPMGAKVIGLSGSTKINRQDFGVSWNKALDSGGYVVGDEVTINVSFEADAK